MTLGSSHRQTGFTLIEVMIAAAIMIASMGLLLQLFGSGLDRLQRVGEQAHLIVAEREIHAQIGLLNLASRSSGTGLAAGWAYSWKARQIEPYRHVSGDLGEAPFPRYVALYAIDVVVERPERPDVEWETQSLGWRASP